MRLIVFRHGNTFAPGEPVVCAGRQPGLALVATGLAQAEAAGAALQAAKVAPHAWCTSPRLRSQQFLAGLRARVPEVGSPRACELDARLDEIDYGPWTGRTRADIAAHGGAADVHAWDVLGRWPQAAGWGASEAELAAETRAFATTWAARAPADAAVVAVSHAGRMRCLLDLVPVEAGAGPHAAIGAPRKVACGHAVALAWRDGVWHLLGWNVAPQGLRAALAC